VQVSRANVTTSPAAIKAASVVPTPIVVPYQSVALTIPNASAPCSASSSSGVSVNLRNGPGTTFGIVGTLVYGTSLSVYGQSNNGWYQVIDNGQLVWVSSSVTALGGNCDNLPDVTPADLNNGTLQLVIADNGWGSVYENIASTDVNPSELITVSAPTLTATQHYQEFTLTLVCSGTGTEGLRWGAAEQPTLKCGSSVVMPLTTAYREQVIAVTMPPMAASNNVQYTLMASRRI
jgi:SH3 domain-containing protein